MQELPQGLGLSLTPLPLAGALGDAHPEVRWLWPGQVPRDKAVTAATCPGQGHPEGWKGLGEEQAPPGIAVASASRPLWHS